MIDKEIKGKFKTRHATNEQIREYKRHGSELIDGEKIMYTRDDIIAHIIMSCRIRTPESIEFGSKLGFNQHDIILSREQSVI